MFYLFIREYIGATGRRKRKGVGWSWEVFWLYFYLFIFTPFHLLIRRREKRVGEWRNFQEDPEAKKVRVASYKEERRTDSKHGKAVLEEWKKSWK